MDKREIIAKLNERNSRFAFPEQAEMMANLLKTVSSDIYSESHRFIFELIQNADDAAEGSTNEVNFDFLPGALIVSHNGKAFDEKDITSLTSAGTSTKKLDSSKTGYKGIGFKSVFGRSQRVTVISGGFQFRFDKSAHQTILPWQIIPIWTETNQLSTEIQNSLKANYNVRTIIELSNTETLYRDLIEILSGSEVLLFLRKISQVSVSQAGKVDFSIKKQLKAKDDVGEEVVLYKNETVVSSWLLRVFNNITVPDSTKLELKNDESIPDKLKDIQVAEIAFAARLEKGAIVSLNPNQTLVFTYLPTKVREFRFPFLVNAAFTTNAGREALHDDSPWNKWLFDLIGEKIFDWLVEISKTKYKFQLLRILPEKFNHLQHPLKNQFDECFSRVSATRAFIPTKKGNVKTLSEVILDRTGLSNQSFIEESAIIDFLKKEKGLALSEDCFVSEQLLESYKLSSIGVGVFELENIRTFFESKSFISSHTVKSNFQLIQFLKAKSDGDKKGLWFQELETLPFIYDENSVLKNPSTGICFPTGIASTELGSIPVIHSTVFDAIRNDKSMLDWLKQLGVKEPSEATYVTNVLIPNINNADFINQDNYLQVTHYLFRLKKEQKLTDEMLEGLRELRIKTKNAEEPFIEAQKCFLSNRYLPQLKIEGLIEVPLVSEEYLFEGSNELEWNLFFKDIKVKDRIDIETINANNSLGTLRVLTTPNWVEYCLQIAKQKPGAFGFGEHNTISNVRIPSFLRIASVNIDYCRVFWTNLITNVSVADLIESAVVRYGVGYGKNSYSASVENLFPWYIRNEPVIPTSTNEILKANEVFVNSKEIVQIAGDILPVFDYDKELPEEWKTLLQLKRKLSLNDYLKLLDIFAAKFTERDQITKALLKRLGQIYNNIGSQISDGGLGEVEIIKSWGTTCKVLSTDGRFESPTALKWITIEGFASEIESLKLIQIPDNCQKNNYGFKQFMTLLGVQIIEEFEPTFKEIVYEESLKGKLQNILPYIAAITAKRKVEDASKEFSRMYGAINSINFYTTSQINLSFTHNMQSIEGPALTVYRKDVSFYYKGKWSSERTMLNLARELADTIDSKGLNEEIRFLLLEQSEEEIKAWIIEQGIEITSLPEIKVFTNPNLDFVGTPSSTHESVGVKPSASPISTSMNEFAEAETFTPTIAVEDINPGDIKLVTQSAGVPGSSFRPYYEIQNDETRLAIGRWSEEYVFKYLKNDSRFTNVVWENEKNESGNPYDFKTILVGEEKYIEVKGTPSSDKDLIYLSSAEWNILSEKKNDYIIIRVFQAGRSDAYLKIFENPFEKIQNGEIQIALKV